MAICFFFCKISEIFLEAIFELETFKIT